jgi:hypothetical protein
MRKQIKKLFTPLAAGITSLAAPLSAFAQTETITPPALDEVAENNILDIIRAIIQFILVVAFVLAFIMLLIGGIRWITAGGDEKAVGSARNMITAALIGLVIVLVAFALIKLVETFFGVSIISGGVTIPTIENTAR